ncbi:ATP-binding protein [Luteimonas notoginsengisoli]|jgi:two-component system, sensor histidine kinase RpfC|uniref:histidine kinase n=1 Tax=Luteimonas notoginsengisoli TaxID=1578200 RepID=A0ABV7URC4_9GAMM
MDKLDHMEMQRNVRAQAVLRARFGLPVSLVMLVATFFWAPTHQGSTSAVVVGIVTAYVLYIVAALHFSSKWRSLSARDLVLITAIADPLMLSGWLFMAGESSTLLVGFYLFTILGFGFRIGPMAMHLCQVTSLVGFSLVALVSPVWSAHPFFALSHVVLLIVVPLYAASLMRKLQMAKALAERESQAKSQLLANVSHELRTPLTGIVSSAQLIEVETGDRAIADRARAILAMATSLDGEIKQLLDLSKVEAEAADTDAIPFDLRLATGHVMRALAPIAAVKNLRLELDLDPALRAPVMGRPQDLISVLMNLAGNAVKFTHEGSVVIRARLVEERAGSYRIRFGVQDTGIGIPADLQSRIFEPFFQVETGPSRRYSGTGLGTTIAREHVRKMGATLNVESTEGQGSQFWFEVDLRTVASQPEAQAGSAAPASVAARRILIADDNALNLDLMKEMLLKDGHEVVAATSGEQALVALGDDRFDVVFLDFNMEDIDGLTVFQTYRFGRVETAPTFFVTADATTGTADKLRDAGAAGVIHKPVTFGKLRDAISGLSPSTEAAAGGAPTREPRRAVSQIKAVPVEYLDPEALENLREIRDTPEFLFKMISEGMADIETIAADLMAAIRSEDLPGVHRHAHAMRGVALNIGAIRLAALADRLMSVTSSALTGQAGRWMVDLGETTSRSLEALDALKLTFGLPGVAKSR